MATIGSDPNGRKRILFVASDGSRKTIRLGKASMKQAESIKVKVEDLIAAASGAKVVEDETARWLAELPDTMHGRLAAVKLVKPRNRTNLTLGAFLDECFAALVVKPSTLTTMKQTRRCLVEYFTESKAIRDVSAADADKWRQWMRDEKKLAQPTISKRVKTARQAFKKAVKWKLIAENPFADVVAGSQTNKGRQFFVTRDVAQKVIDACPDTEWKLIFALSRYGGLRCPSEHLALKWTDIDWGNNRITVRSCKTEHMEGGDCRIIPLFPELEPLLLKALDAAEPGADYVIARVGYSFDSSDYDW